MKIKIFFLLTILFISASSALAHPLGNFSVNQYSRIEVEKHKIKIRQVLDLAEIPTFQLSDKIDTDKDKLFSNSELNTFAERITPEYLSNLILRINEQKLNFQLDSSKILLQEGAGNLPILRLELNLSVMLNAQQDINNAEFENNNYLDRIGWNEIVLQRIGKINIFASTAFGSGLTDELKSYPEANLNAPLNERMAKFKFTNNSIPENAQTLQNRDGHTTVAVQKDRLAELIAVPEITPPIILFGLLLAFGLGAIHAMSPGHGKTVVGAYLVGSRGTIKHAAFLGLTVTITHTLGVFALGLITLFASNYILPEKILPMLSFISGLLVLYIGLTMFKSRLLTALGWQNDNNHQHSHSHDTQTHSHIGHTHTHDGHTHSHLPPEEISWKSLLALGISGGLLPCPSALVLMLSAINLNRIGYGLILTFFFSFGLAATLTAVGLVFLNSGKFVSGSKLSKSRIFKTLPIASALLIAFLGATICYNSLT